MLDGNTHVLILGAKGMLGTDLSAQLAGKCRETAWDLGELELTERSMVLADITNLNPDIVINCAAYTDVDGCESDRVRAREVNSLAPGYIAEACAKTGAWLIHFGTDYIFDGDIDRDYLENDVPNPLNVYGTTKLEGEERIQHTGARYTILRTQWLYGKNGRNFVDTIRRLAKSNDHLRVVRDQIGCFTWTRELAAGVVQLLETDAAGIFNIAADGSGSWYDVACEIVHTLGLDVDVEPVTSDQFPRPARRPKRSVLSCDLLAERYGIRLRDWREALREYLTGVF